jgi:hypothetical protein
VWLVPISETFLPNRGPILAGNYPTIVARIVNLRGRLVRLFDFRETPFVVPPLGGLSAKGNSKKTA